MRSEPAYDPPQHLVDFLHTGTTPIYIGFGSIVAENSQELTQIILDSCRAAGVRVIISRGWSKLGGCSPNTKDVLYLDDCPHGLRYSPLLYECARGKLITAFKVAFQACGCRGPSRRGWDYGLRTAERSPFHYHPFLRRVSILK